MERKQLIQRRGPGEEQRPGTISFAESVGWWMYLQEDKNSTSWNLPVELVDKIQKLEDELEVLRAIGSKTPIQPSNEPSNYTYSVIGSEPVSCRGCPYDEELVIMAFLRSWGFSPEQMLEYLAERFPQEAQEEA